MYNAYSEKNDSPVYRTFMYMTILHFFITVAVLIFLEKLLLMNNIFSEAVIDTIKKGYLFWIVIFGGIMLLTYVSYFRKSIDYYESIFSKWKAANRLIKVWMLIVLPFLILFGSINIYIGLFGGYVFGKEVIGFFGGH
jgi:hypothetical protein